MGCIDRASNTVHQTRGCNMQRMGRAVETVRSLYGSTPASNIYQLPKKGQSTIDTSKNEMRPGNGKRLVQKFQLGCAKLLA